MTAQKAWTIAYRPLAEDDRRHNLLVCSDLHFGETLLPSDAGFIKTVARLNHAFCRFLAHYAKNRIEDRPWRLVIAGDMIDFLRASLLAQQEELAAASAESSAVRALERIFHHERKVFRALAAFVDAGNQLVIIRGNHDAPFHWDAVQRRFVELMLELREGQEEADGFRARISFYRWFYFERDVVYIEHGNQYDEWCSFEHVLEPVLPDDGHLEDPLSHRLMKAFAGKLEGLDVHGVESWRMMDFVRWIWGLGPRVIGSLAYRYFASIAWMLDMRRRLAHAASTTRERHLEMLKELTRRFHLGEDVVRALDALRMRPAGFRIRNGIRILYMDRVFLLLLNVLVLSAVLAAPGDGVVRAGLGGSCAIFSVLALVLFGRYRETESHPKLLRTARNVAQLLKVPFVVFGHSHVPVARPVVPESKTWYFNTGSWTAGEEHGLTFLEIHVGETGPSAELKRWDVKTHCGAKVEWPQHSELPPADPSSR